MRILVSGSTRATLEVARLYPNHIGHLTTPLNGNRPLSLASTGLPWGVDNGCFKGLDETRFRDLLSRVSGLPSCLFVVVPDMVGNAKATLELFHQWEGTVRKTKQPLAFVGQDGAENLDILWEHFDAWFVGGSTIWKLSQASADLIAEAKARGRHVHMGRVNTLRRLEAAWQKGCDTVDGSCFSRWADDFLLRSVRFVAALERQPLLF